MRYGRWGGPIVIWTGRPYYHDYLRRLLKNYRGARLGRCAVLGILMYIEYIAVPARRAPRI